MIAVKQAEDMSAGSKKFISGVVEGFYGRPWSTEQRLDLFGCMSRWGLNSYLYAPKDDDKHRAYWREMYSLEEADRLSQVIRAAASKGVHFIYAISPGLDMTFSSANEVALLKKKLDQITALGCKCFAILFDDIDSEMCPADTKVFLSFAHAQVAVTNEIYTHLESPEIFLFCPTEYCMSKAVPCVLESQYLKQVGEDLHPNIDIMWTGPKIISKTIPLSSVKELTLVLKRCPVIWDNLHANDYDQRRLFLGPYSGRLVSLLPFLNGVLTNPNCEYDANYVPIHTMAQWVRCYPGGTSSKKAVRTCPPCCPPVHSRGAPAAVLMGNQDLGEGVGVGGAGGGGGEGGGGRGEEKLLGEAEDGDEDLISEATYNPAHALESALKDWIQRFSVFKRQPDNYKPAKDPSSLAKALEADQLDSGDSAEGDRFIKPELVLPPCESDSSCPGAISMGEEATMMQMDTPPPEMDKHQTVAFSLEDLHLLVDYFFLPHQHGKKALHILQEFCWLKENTPPYEAMEAERMEEGGEGEEEEEEEEVGEGEGGGGGKGESGEREVGRGGVAAKVLDVEDGMRSDGESYIEEQEKSHVKEWMQRAKKFHGLCSAVSLMFDRLTAIPNRPLLYDMYQYCWDAKETTMLLDSYVSWLASGGSEVCPEHEPHCPQGGITAEMQHLLSKGLESPPKIATVIRPYLAEDKALLYQTCLETGDSGVDATKLFPNYPDLLGDRYVGPYLARYPDLSFVLVDSKGVCGYVLAALDSQEFYKWCKDEWILSVLPRYSTTEKGQLTPEELSLLKEFHSPCFYLPSHLHEAFPSHIHIDLMRRAQGKGFGTSMVRTILSILKGRGSRGVHLEMSARNKRAYKFYQKLGFSKYAIENEPCAKPEQDADVLIMKQTLL